MDRSSSLRRAVCAGAAGLAIMLGAGIANATSSWGSAVGFPDGNNATWWCGPLIQTDSATGRQYITSVLQRVASDGTAGGFVSNGLLSQRSSAQCFASSSLTGPSTTVTSA
jgi:hypothetical protein